jgi:hypothetical protein
MRPLGPVKFLAPMCLLRSSRLDQRTSIVAIPSRALYRIRFITPEVRSKIINSDSLKRLSAHRIGLDALSPVKGQNH